MRNSSQDVSNQVLLQPKSLVYKRFWRFVGSVLYHPLSRQGYKQGQCGGRSHFLEAESIEKSLKLIDINLLYACLMRD
jgi:hypothetical protein